MSAIHGFPASCESSIWPTSARLTYIVHRFLLERPAILWRHARWAPGHLWGHWPALSGMHTDSGWCICCKGSSWFWFHWFWGCSAAFLSQDRRCGLYRDEKQERFQSLWYSGLWVGGIHDANGWRVVLSSSSFVAFNLILPLSSLPRPIHIVFCSIFIIFCLFVWPIAPKVLLLQAILTAPSADG